MSEKTEYFHFRTLVIPFLFFYMICFFISFFVPWVYILPVVVAFIFSFMLRFHLVKYYNLEQTNGCLECLTNFFCFPCSVAQSKTLYNMNVGYLSLNPFIRTTSGPPRIRVPKDIWRWRGPWEEGWLRDRLIGPPLRYDITACVAFC